MLQLCKNIPQEDDLSNSPTGFDANLYNLLLLTDCETKHRPGTILNFKYWTGSRC